MQLCAFQPLQREVPESGVANACVCLRVCAAAVTAAAAAAGQTVGRTWCNLLCAQCLLRELCTADISSCRFASHADSS